MKVTTDQQRDVVVIAGSSGFIGTATIEKLAKKFRVVAFDRETSPHPPVVAEHVCSRLLLITCLSRDS